MYNIYYMYTIIYIIYIYIYSNHYITGMIRLLGKYGQMVGSAVDFQPKCWPGLAVLKKSSDIFVALGEVPRCNFMRLGTCQKPVWCVAMERITKRPKGHKLEKKQHEISGSTVQAWVMTSMADMILLPPSHPEIAVICLANHPEQATTTMILIQAIGMNHQTSGYKFIIHHWWLWLYRWLLIMVIRCYKLSDVNYESRLIWDSYIHLKKMIPVKTVRS